MLTLQHEWAEGSDEVQAVILNELGEYNLYLLRNIYDAFEGKGDRIVANFRENNFTGLRPKALVVPPDVLRMQRKLLAMIKAKLRIDKANASSMY